MVKVIRSIVGGFLMGSADLVPGVSGGTIAVVIGIYERLVNSIREASSALGALVRLDLAGVRQHLARVEWVFIVPLLGGIGLAIVALSSALEHLLEEQATVMAGAFFGLVAGSVVVAWRLIVRPQVVHALIAALVAVGIFLLLGLGEDAVVPDPALLAFFGAGALAICAMILPGISGSLILVLIGMYPAVIGAVNDRDLAVIGVLTLGAVIGLALFSQVLHWALERHHAVMLSALVGLMAGSTRVLWPWPDGVDSAALAAPGSDWPGVLVAAIVGLGAVFAISRLAASSEEVSAPRSTV